MEIDHKIYTVEQIEQAKGKKTFQIAGQFVPGSYFGGSRSFQIVGEGGTSVKVFVPARMRYDPKEFGEERVLLAHVDLDTYLSLDRYWLKEAQAMGSTWIKGHPYSTKELIDSGKKIVREGVLYRNEDSYVFETTEGLVPLVSRSTDLPIYPIHDHVARHGKIYGKMGDLGFEVAGVFVHPLGYFSLTDFSMRGALTIARSEGELAMVQDEGALAVTEDQS